MGKVYMRSSGSSGDGWSYSDPWTKDDWDRAIRAKEREANREPTTGEKLEAVAHLFKALLDL